MSIRTHHYAAVSGAFFNRRYASQTGVIKNTMALPKGQRTFVHKLNDAGYDPHYIGKSHLSEKGGNHWVPPKACAGFQSFIGWESHHLDHHQGKIWKDAPNDTIQLKGHETDGFTDIVCEELGKLSGHKKPFFMAVSYQAPHAPCTPPEEHYNKYDSSVCDWSVNTDRETWFKAPIWSADYGVEEFRKLYFGEITNLDFAFWHVLKGLEVNGLIDNTIVVFTSDHGEMCGCHGLFGKGLMGLFVFH